MSTQRQVTTFVASGLVAPCTRCRKLPKHFFDGRRPQAGGGHFFECQCGVQTSRHATEAETNADWRRCNGYPARNAVDVYLADVSRRGVRA